MLKGHGVSEQPSAIADVDDAVLKGHCVSEQPSATADVDDAVLEGHGVSEQPFATADVDDAVLKGHGVSEQPFATVDVDDAVLERHNVGGVFFMGTHPSLQVVLDVPSPTGDHVDLCNRPSHINMGHGLIEYMDGEECFHGDTSGCDGTTDDESHESTLILILFNVLILVMSLLCSGWRVCE